MAAGYHYGVKLRITPTGLSPASAAASLAALPPPALPGFLGNTGPSATPTGPACPSRDSGWCVPHHRRGFPCCVLFPSFMHASANTPAGAASASIALFPAATGLPLFRAGSTPTLPVSGPARRSLTFRPACSLNRLSRSFCQSASIHVVTSMNRPDCYQPETIVAGRDSHPLERGAFHGARGSRVRHDRQGSISRPAGATGHWTARGSSSRGDWLTSTSSRGTRRRGRASWTTVSPNSGPSSVLRTETLPAAQRSISLARVERHARTVRAESLHPDGQADAEARRRTWGHPHLSASRHDVGRMVHAETVLELVDGLGSPADDGECQNPWGQTARPSVSGGVDPRINGEQRVAGNHKM